ncbi:hypothetical protein ElyMa_002096500 [Elysia marginata]|uniref:Uncharacterized protein n=1 Tax=Elysia marginata TaxID=1093978 RepID=A0AAV4FES4_9GAST|nr:hypothetical protein ElyMa_002096500 [Elysia marginata]
MAGMLFKQSLCSRDDIVGRTSCTGRCGEQSDTRASPGQSNVQFHDSPPLQCTINTAFSLPDLLTLEQELNLVEPNIFEMYCDLEGFKQTTLQDITLALKNGKCVTSALTRGDRPSSRSCDRPDVLLCESYRKNNFYNVFPLHLQCFDQRLTYHLTHRFDVLGMNSMETISKHGQCRLLRLPPTGRISDDLDNNSEEWTSKLDVLRLEVARSLNMTFFDFQSGHLGQIRCTGTGNATDTKCAMFECPHRHLLDNQSQTCCLPERVIFQTFETKIISPGTGEETGTTPGKSGASNANSS